MGDRAADVPAHHLMPNDVALARVRAACRPLHDQLEAVMGLAVPERLDMVVYTDALMALAAVVPHVERWQADAAGAWRLERLAAELAADLDELGRGAGPARWIPPAHASPAVAWGTAYVVEGSRLGAGVVLATLATHLPTAPRRYFERAAAGRVRWPDFRRRFGAEVTDDADVDDACAAATSVFESLLHACADRAGPRPAGEG